MLRVPACRFLPGAVSMDRARLCVLSTYRSYAFACVVAIGLFSTQLPCPLVAADDFRVTPAEIKLNGNFARAQVVVTRLDSDGNVSAKSEDLTSAATFQSSDESVFKVNSRGELLGVGNGLARLATTAAGVSHEVAVQVSDVQP